MIVRTYQSEVRRLQPKPKPAPVEKVRVQRRWTDEEIQRLIEMRAANMSFGRIAKKLGRTRNSLIGFDWRRRRQ